MATVESVILTSLKKEDKPLLSKIKMPIKASRRRRAWGAKNTYGPKDHRREEYLWTTERWQQGYRQEVVSKGPIHTTREEHE